MSQEDKATKRQNKGYWCCFGWRRKRMNKTHIKGKRKSKKFVGRARRRVGIALIKASLEKEG